jgi:hypothetical protein
MFICEIDIYYKYVYACYGSCLFVKLKYTCICMLWMNKILFKLKLNSSAAILELCYTVNMAWSSEDIFPVYCHVLAFLQVSIYFSTLLLHFITREMTKITNSIQSHKSYRIR